MKNIILVRHAKSSWENSLPDMDRPLNNRGFNDAAWVANSINNKLPVPQLILSSPANRAKTTASIFIKNLNWQHIPYYLNDALYDFSGERVVSVIKECSNAVNSVFVFGHNHAMTAIANTFGSLHFNNVPTCGLVHIRVAVDKWKDFTAGETIFKVFPKDLK